MCARTVLRYALTFVALFACMFILGIIASSLWLTGGASWFDVSLIGSYNFVSPVIPALVCTYAMNIRCSRPE